MTQDLASLVSAVAKIGEVYSASYPSHDLAYELWTERRKKADAAAIEALQALGASVRHDWRGAALKLGGGRSTATGGIGGVMTNWLRAARARLEKEEAR